MHVVRFEGDGKFTYSDLGMLIAHFSVDPYFLTDFNENKQFSSYCNLKSTRYSYI